MPDLEWNQTAWAREYDWSLHGEEWSAGWGSSRAQWFGTLLPRIQAFVPAERLLEIAPGFGRWTRFLIPLARDYVGVDLSERCIAHCRQEFAGAGHASFHVNDGRALGVVEPRSRDFVFSFDSLVHVEMDVMDGYANEILRVLAPSGVAFIHHSNAGATTLHDNPHHRALSVSAEQLREKIAAAGGRVWIQEIIDWGDCPRIDALTLFSRAEAPGPASMRLLVNDDFMEEQRLVREFHEPWSALPRRP